MYLRLGYRFSCQNRCYGNTGDWPWGNLCVQPHKVIYADLFLLHITPQVDFLKKFPQTPSKNFREKSTPPKIHIKVENTPKGY